MGCDRAQLYFRDHGQSQRCGDPSSRSVLARGQQHSGGQSRPASGLSPVAVLEGAESIGIRLTRVYGLTEVYGPASVCAEQPGWNELAAEQRAELKRRQGVPYPLQEAVTVIDPETMREVPRDGETIGEVGRASCRERGWNEERGGDIKIDRMRVYAI